MAHASNILSDANPTVFLPFGQKVFEIVLPGEKTSH
jgi:hypothetical protein